MQNIQKKIETITDIRNKVSYDIKNIVFFYYSNIVILICGFSFEKNKERYDIIGRTAKNIFDSINGFC